jgi:AcrR family transcriptional regulator
VSTTTPRALLSVEAIVDVALRTVDTTGPDALSLRGVARELGVTAPALYDHIRSKDDLLRLVAHEGYAVLAAVWSDLDRHDVDDWVRRSSAAYVAFALDRPGLFAVMFRYRPSFVAGPGDVEDDDATAIFRQALDVLVTAVERGELARDPLEMALGLWAAVHGVATVRSLSPEMAEADWLLEIVVDALLTGWKERP